MNSQIINYMGIFLLVSLGVFVGCGGDDTDSTPEAPTLIQLKVMDGYILDANVSFKGKSFIWDGNVTYESYTSAINTEDVFLSTGGIHDLNGNSLIDNEDVHAVDMKAPANYRNINPFTTLLVENKHLSAQNLLDYFSSVEGVYLGDINDVNGFDIDIVKASTGVEGNPEIMRQAAILTLLFSIVKTSE